MLKSISFLGRTKVDLVHDGVKAHGETTIGLKMQPTFRLTYPTWDNSSIWSQQHALWTPQVNTQSSIEAQDIRGAVERKMKARTKQTRTAKHEFPARSGSNRVRDECGCRSWSEKWENCGEAALNGAIHQMKSVQPTDSWAASFWAKHCGEAYNCRAPQRNARTSRSEPSRSEFYSSLF